MSTDTIIGTIIGGIIGVGGSLVVLFYKESKEKKDLQRSLKGELHENLEIIKDRNNPMLPLKGDIYNYLKSTARIGIFSLKLNKKKEKVFRAVLAINQDISDYQKLQPPRNVTGKHIKHRVISNKTTLKATITDTDLINELRRLMEITI